MGIQPSAALVKAMLISSARQPTSNMTLHAPNDDHGDCQASLTGDQSGNAYCAMRYDDPLATCQDLTVSLMDPSSPGKSVFCNLPNATADCMHTIHCCLCRCVSLNDEAASPALLTSLQHQKECHNVNAAPASVTLEQQARSRVVSAARLLSVCSPSFVTLVQPQMFERVEGARVTESWNLRTLWTPSWK